MANSGPHRSPEANTTRQMLDELDALMERMLALPVNELEEELGSSPVSRSRPVVEAPPAPGPQLLPSSVPAPPVAEPAKIIAHRGISYRLDEATGTADEPSALATGKAREAAPPIRQPVPETLFTDHAEPDAELPALHELLPPLIVKPATLDSSRPPVLRPSLLTRCLQPLVWINQTYDHSTYWMGGIGRWLRGPRGRTLIGSIGLVLFALATLWWLHDLLGWNWLQDPLE